MIKRTRYVSVAFAAVFPVLLLSAAQGCGNKDKDEPPPAVSVAPVPTPAPTPTAPATVMPEEDAGAAPDAAADADAAKPVGTGGSAAGTISKCCAALAQNANSAPPEQKGSYLAAAAACNGLKATPVAQQAFAQIRAFLAGAKMPGACQ